MRYIPSSATVRTIPVFKALNRMSKEDIIYLNILAFSEQFSLSYTHVRQCVRAYRAINGLF
jgi:hypothetical protein